MLENFKKYTYNQSEGRINQLLKEHSTVISVQLKQKRSKSLSFYLFFHFWLDPDPEQIIPDPGPGKSSGSNRIWFRNTAKNKPWNFKIAKQLERQLTTLNRVPIGLNIYIFFPHCDCAPILRTRV